MTHDTTPHDTLKQNAENRLNLRIGDRNTMETERETGSLWNVYIKTPNTEHQEGSFYHLRTCSECGNTQAMNLEAERRLNPTMYKNAEEAVRQREADKYIKEGEPPAVGESLKRKIEEYLNTGWDNTLCEQRHPPKP